MQLTAFVLIVNIVNKAKGKVYDREREGGETDMERG